jgi:hypothetical protein
MARVAMTSGVESGRAVGIVTGVIDGKGRQVIASGKASLSVTKVVTSLIFADMIVKGEVKPDGPASPYADYGAARSTANDMLMFVAMRRMRAATMEVGTDLQIGMAWWCCAIGSRTATIWAGTYWRAAIRGVACSQDGGDARRHGRSSRPTAGRVSKLVWTRRRRS